MLKKLMKYDIKWINKLLIVYYIIAIILCLLTRISSLMNSSIIGNIIYQILKGLTISAFASCLINSVIRIWVRFRNTNYKDEAYLIHTLPVSNETLYNSKILSSIVCFLLTFMVIIVGFLLAFINQDVINIIKNLFNNSSFLIIGIIITVFLELTYMMYSGLLGIILGHRSNSKRLLKSFIIGIVIYFAFQIIILLIIYLIGLFNNDVGLLFTIDLSSIKDLYPLKLLLIITDILYLINIGIMYFVGKKYFVKGVNVE